MARRRHSNPLSKIGKRQLQRGVGAIIVFIALFLVGLFHPELLDRILQHDPAPSKRSLLQEGVWPVVRVVDGDTLIVRNDEGIEYRIRLIGADTPEVVKPNHPVEPFGPEASTFTKKMVADSGNSVRVAFDGDQVDRYERTLAMIYIRTASGEILLNELLIREGLARAQTQYRYSTAMKDRFRDAENAAKAEKRNIWSEK